MGGLRQRLATIVWMLVAVFAPDAFGAANIATLTGAAGTVLGFLFGYVFGDPLRGQE